MVSMGSNGPTFWGAGGTMYDGNGGDAEDPRRRPGKGGSSSSGGWDEVDGDPQTYDPSPVPASQQGWDDWASPRYQDPDPRAYQDPRYRFAPPPANYPAYPPPYAYPYPYPVPPRPPSNTVPIAGGVLVLIAGALGLLWMSIMWSGFELIGLGFGTCYVIELVFCILAIIGGIFAMARRMFPLAVLGAIFSMLTFGFFFICPLLGLIGLILILVGKDAFQPSGGFRGRTW